MLWACLRFCELPLAAVYVDAEGADVPRAITEGPRQRPQIALANRAARASGVRRGQPAAAAQALCSRLVLRPRDLAAEKNLLDLLAAWAYRYSGQVSLAEPTGLLLEVGASLRLFGGWPALERRLREDLRQLGHAHQLAVAPWPSAAKALARTLDGLGIFHAPLVEPALGPLPIAAGGLPAETIAALQGMGLTQLRDLFRLPRPELTRRIGPDGTLLLDRLRGLVAEPLPLYQPPDRYERRLELEGHIDSWPPLLFPLRRLTRELALFLAARDGGVQRLDIVLEHGPGAATRVPVEFVEAQREADGLFEFCRGRLERVAIGGEVVAIGLVATDLPDFRPRHQDLFETRRQGLDWPALVERLRARLGDTAVRQLALNADHRPERAWRHGAPDSAGIAPPQRPRPLWLLPQPVLLRPEPQRILAGPERIESGWWDGGDVRRDYYIVQMRSGQRAWAYVPAGARTGWMLHGWFA